MDNGRYSFSQAQGYEEIPGPLKLEELPQDARTRIWNLFFVHLRQSMSRDDRLGWGSWIGGDWADVFQAAHAKFDVLPLDDWSTDFEPFCNDLRKRIESLPFKKVFDLIQFVLRHPRCPQGFVTEMKSTFADSRLAYTLARISDMAVVPYRQDQAPRLDFWGSDIRNHTTEGDTLWVNYTTSHFSSRSTVS